ncbi:hypothetical protein [Actinomadura sp. DC4]|uniref:hypothetical protein n=1 Tax=Actinomadura sp. DC4 TaxID=3055069 RepID=UPI0025B00610|nr:hypothetical protein [Actinomadura sp. DC4]MDN3356656.1 hypothetical protein [Actinomadura sp. DC4]
MSTRVSADPEEMTVLVAEVVSAGWLVFRKGTEAAGFWGGSTLPAWRGQGIYRAPAPGSPPRAIQVDDSAARRSCAGTAVTAATPYVRSPP